MGLKTVVLVTSSQERLKLLDHTTHFERLHGFFYCQGCLGPASESDVIGPGCVRNMETIIRSAGDCRVQQSLRISMPSTWFLSIYVLSIVMIILSVARLRFPPPTPPQPDSSLSFSGPNLQMRGGSGLALHPFTLSQF